MTNLGTSLVRNTSGLHPKGRAVLVLPNSLENELRARGSKIVVPETASECAKMIEDRGVLIEVGAAAWMDEPEPRAVVGEFVLTSKWSGTLFTSPLDGLMYKLCNADDVYATAEEGFVFKALAREEAA
jgi:co-chaperonin GroES (HSP10)